MKLVVTTTLSKIDMNEFLAEFLIETNLPFIAREDRSIVSIQEDYRADGVIVWNREGPVLYIKGEKFFYHPSMAKTRISFFRQTGTNDPLINALGLRNNDKLLDCTLGLGADATVASYFNPSAQVVALESSSPIAWIVKWGMKLYNSKMEWLNEAIHRIEVINSEHLAYFKLLPDSSFDIVYFDPMFRKPLLKSTAISPLRLLANHNPLTPSSIEEACRIARRRVVVKEVAGSEEFDQLGINTFISSPNNKITYGIIDL
ncbi:MAG TPA: class I SAM-dependent methyltransferase [Syntrophomonadaceae bacterium]|nr:class I SAM-dependent methyltransferase [Syntrophomonadaceae bacterium]